MIKGEYVAGDRRNPQAKQNFHKYCSYCGHTMSFYAFEKDKKCCDYCARLNYKSKTVEFRYKLQDALKRLQTNEN